LIGKVIAKLDELHLRENTLVLILGDNGTGSGTPSKFKGRDVVGGKGKPTMWGTHVPAIGNWPGHFASGKVYADLIDATDFVPTLCDATATPVPAELKLDGRSFLPQLRGEKGNPRDWLYAWYNPSGGAKALFEFAHDAQYKLYTDGRFYAVEKDDTEKSPLADAALDAGEKTERVKLQSALDQFAGPRDDAFVRKAQRFGGERGEDANGNKIKKAAADGSGGPTTRAAPRQTGSRASRFDARDINHDGKISREEFISTASDKEHANARFDAMDADKDGFLSRDEFMNAGAKPK
ncbi:MAG TPA: sulfatase-like hydrolase/transferase, partial [Tepidisphaeraceae bacterium]|nr:sulfatase-like hydrolase/transferase [Tepidisphaeraceae bacterium]